MLIDLLIKNLLDLDFFLDLVDQNLILQKSTKDQVAESDADRDAENDPKVVRYHNFNAKQQLDEPMKDEEEGHRELLADVEFVLIEILQVYAVIKRLLVLCAQVHHQLHAVVPNPLPDGDVPLKELDTLNEHSNHGHHESACNEAPIGLDRVLLEEHVEVRRGHV